MTVILMHPLFVHNPIIGAVRFVIIRDNFEGGETLTGKIFILPPSSGPAPRFKLFCSAYPVAEHPLIFAGIYRQQWMGSGFPRTFGRAAAVKDSSAGTPPVVSSTPIASGIPPFTFPISIDPSNFFTHPELPPHPVSSSTAFSQCWLNLLLLVQVEEMFLMTAMRSITLFRSGVVGAFARTGRNPTRNKNYILLCSKRDEILNSGTVHSQVQILCAELKLSYSSPTALRVLYSVALQEDKFESFKIRAPWRSILRREVVLAHRDWITFELLQILSVKARHLDAKVEDADRGFNLSRGQKWFNLE
ncbi:hypothetical protein K438DRAFT_1772428 [Mycena galopus ATCC 62051]|nr:hypothetical protein K438DRAFT_1772428 [Mycena galopus ATCC 62051]